MEKKDDAKVELDAAGQPIKPNKDLDNNNKNDDKTDSLIDKMSNLCVKDEDETKKDKGETKIDKYETFISKLKNGEFKKIAFLTGAGTSTSAGIPDFRSPNGLFKQLQEKYNLSSPSEFFDIDTFYKNPEYFYEFSKNLDLYSYKPTPFHYFMGFLEKKGLLKILFTQNIDGLDLRCGIPFDKVVCAHGNYLEGHCPKCKKDVDMEQLREHIAKGEIYKCPTCQGPCKPKIVFYGEMLPMKFFENLKVLKDVDLAIVCGTSLLVGPFNSLPYEVDENCWRIVINKEKVGDLYGHNCFKYDDDDSTDYLMVSYADDAVKKIVKDCGWEEDFNKFMEETKKNIP